MRRSSYKKHARKHRKKVIRRRDSTSQRATQEENLRLMGVFFEAASAHDVNRIGTLVDEAYVGESDTLPAPLTGRKAYLDFLRMYYRAISDCHYEIEQMIASGDYVVTRLRLVGTHRGELWGNPPTNRQFEIHLCHFDQIKNGKVVRAWIYWDTATMLRQLGLGLG